MVEGVTPENIALFKEAFSMFDRDGEGIISTRDIGAIMRSLGYSPTEAELADILNEVDSEGDGVIDYPTFQVLMSIHIKSLKTVNELMEAFQAFDRDKKGHVTCEDLRAVLSQVGEKLSTEEIDEILRTADSSEDGVIYYEEFINMMVHG